MKNVNFHANKDGGGESYLSYNGLQIYMYLKKKSNNSYINICGHMCMHTIIENL